MGTSRKSGRGRGKRRAQRLHRGAVRHLTNDQPKVIGSLPRLAQVRKALAST